MIGYPCSQKFRDKLKSIVNDADDQQVTNQKENFIEKVLDAIPEEGAHAFYTLRLFESLVT